MNRCGSQHVLTLFFQFCPHSHTFILLHIFKSDVSLALYLSRCGIPLSSGCQPLILVLHLTNRLDTANIRCYKWDGTSFQDMKAGVFYSWGLFLLIQLSRTHFHCVHIHTHVEASKCPFFKENFHLHIPDRRLIQLLSAFVCPNTFCTCTWYAYM